MSSNTDATLYFGVYAAGRKADASSLLIDLIDYDKLRMMVAF